MLYYKDAKLRRRIVRGSRLIYREGVTDALSTMLRLLGEELEEAS